MRSSIFSFDSLRLGRSAPKGLILALAILLAIEVAVARQDWIWRLAPRSETGSMFAIERLVIEKAEDPVVVFMGSSRVRDAIAPRQLESELELPTGTVLNIALTGGSPLDALRLYQRNRSTLSKARLIVLNFEVPQLAKGQPPSSRDRCLSSLGDRLKWFDRNECLSLVVGYLWRTFDARAQIQGVAASIVMGETGGASIGEDGRVVWREKPLEEGPEEINLAPILKRHFEGFTLGWRQTEAMRAFVEILSEDGVQVMIFHPPLRDSYVEAWTERYPQAHDDVQRALESIENATVCYFEKASELGISDQWFYDYGHLTERGTRTMTARMADILQEKYGHILNAHPHP